MIRVGLYHTNGGAPKMSADTEEIGPWFLTLKECEESYSYDEPHRMAYITLSRFDGNPNGWRNGKYMSLAGITPLRYARVAAAAPEMLRALKELADIVPGLSLHGTPREGREALSRAMDKAEDAIAKAEGSAEGAIHRAALDKEAAALTH